MKTLAEMTAEFKEKIGSDDFWAARAVLAIYARQTADEQQTDETRHENGVGFNGRDAEFLSSIAKQLQERGFTKETRDRVPLSYKQLAAIRKSMKKYAGQLARIVRESQLVAA